MVHRHYVWHLYILRCADDSFYVGHSTDPWTREHYHNEGRGARFTLERRPVTLVYSEPQPSRIAAIARERQIKRWSRAKKSALIRGDLELLKQL